MKKVCLILKSNNIIEFFVDFLESPEFIVDNKSSRVFKRIQSHKEHLPLFIEINTLVCEIPFASSQFPTIEDNEDNYSFHE